MFSKKNVETYLDINEKVQKLGIPNVQKILKIKKKSDYLLIVTENTENKSVEDLINLGGDGLGSENALEFLKQLTDCYKKFKTE